jgi:spermidine synthase
MLFDASAQMWLSAVRLLGRYQGRNGEIEIVECSWDGTRIYFEEGVRQSQATPDGESVFTYVKLMEELLSRSKKVLMLGCGGGTLATRLARLGKRLTIVDNNPISFVIAHKFFGLPDDLPCMVSDFRKFIYDDDTLYDGIAIDVGGPGFQFNDEFDDETCEQDIEDRNAVIACLPEKQLNARPALHDALHGNLEKWSIRRGRLHRRAPACRSRDG